MTPDLMLAQRSIYATPLTGNSSAEVNGMATNAIKQLVPKTGNKFSMQEQEFISYKLIAFVLIAHLSVFVWLNKNKSEVAVLQPQTIAVSLLVNKIAPVSKAEVKLEAKPLAKEKHTQQPLIKKQMPQQQQQKPVNDQPTTETHMDAEPVVNQPAETQAAEIQTVETQAVAAASIVQKTAQAELPVKEEVEQVVEPPKFGAAYLHNPVPEYPPMARRKGEQGRVLLQVLVSENGKVEKVQIDTGSGYSSLDQAALQAVSKWSFVPAKKGNRPVSAYVIVPVRFSLNG